MDRKTLALLLLCFANVAIAADGPAAGPAEPEMTQAKEEPQAKAEPKVAEAKAEPQAKGEPTAGEDKVVCRVERSTGTRFEKKTCRTQSEWARIEERAVDDFGKVRNRPVTCPDCKD